MTLKARSHEQLVVRLAGQHSVGRPIGQLIARVDRPLPLLSHSLIYHYFFRYPMIPLIT